MADIEVLPSELAAAAQPLRRAGEAMAEVADSRRALRALMDASPSARLRESFGAFLAAWELVVWSTADDAKAFGGQVDLAGWYYSARENALANHIPDITPWPMPALRDPVVEAVAPHPAPAPAPVP